MKTKKQKKDRPKIFERNPDTDVIRWRYIDESPDKFGWPNYGRILKTKKKKQDTYGFYKEDGQGKIQSN